MSSPRTRRLLPSIRKPRKKESPVRPRPQRASFSHSRISPGSTATPAQKNHPWTRNCSRRKSGRMWTTFTTSIIRKTTPSAIGGSSEVFRSDEVQVTQLGVGGDFDYDSVQARLMTQFGMYSETTPRNDASPSRGQWNLADAYRYVSEAHGGYHFNALHGINLQAGIFMSYVGLFSYYNSDNWLINRRMLPRTRPGSSTACAFRFFPPST